MRPVIGLAGVAATLHLSPLGKVCVYLSQSFFLLLEVVHRSLPLDLFFLDFDFLKSDLFSIPLRNLGIFWKKIKRFKLRSASETL